MSNLINEVEHSCEVDKHELTPAQLSPGWPPAEPPAHGRGWPQAAPPPANVREWIAYQPSRPSDQRKVVSTDFPAALLRRIDRQLRRATKVRLAREH